jgi:hypothetical protein
MGPPQGLLPPANHMLSSYYTVHSPSTPCLFTQKLYPASVSSIHIKLEEDDKEGVNFTPGFLDE